MKTTPNLAIPYPEPGDHTRLWEYFAKQAGKIDELGVTAAVKLKISQQQSEPDYRPNQVTEFTAAQWPPIELDALTTTLRVRLGCHMRITSTGGCRLSIQVYQDGTSLNLTGWEHELYLLGQAPNSRALGASRTTLIPVTRGAKLKVVPTWHLNTYQEAYLRYGLLTADMVELGGGTLHPNLGRRFPPH